MMLRPFLAAALLGAGLASAPAEPLSKKFDIDFFRDVPSRNLKGMAARSDGRLVAGPVLTPLKGELPVDLLWALEPAGTGVWLLGSGPEGKILEVTIDPAAPTFTTRTLAQLDETQVLALRRLEDGRILAGTSPHGRLYLLAPDGTVQAQVALPVDSILDLTLADGDTVLVATGNPGRIYRVKLDALALAGINPDKVGDAAALVAKGITLLAEIRDRNVRRIVIAGNRIVAGSAPRGNLYTLPLDAAPGTAAVILQENRDAEVTDLYPLPNGDVYAAIVFAGTTAEARVNRPASPADRPPVPEVGATERFPGRSSLIHYPLDGFAETVAARAGIAFYRIARRGDLLLLAGGEQGDLLAYSLVERRSLNFAGSEAAQLNAMAVADPEGNTFILAGNNMPQLARLSFTGTGPRSAETRRLDLGSPTRLGALRFNRVREMDPSQISVSLRTSQATDDLEGWTPWQPAGATADGGWRGTVAPGRQVRLKIELPAGVDERFQIDRGALFHLPQNRRPQLQDFRLVAPNFALIPRVETPAAPTATLGQLLGVTGANPPAGEDRRTNTVLQSQVVIAPGTQIAYWNVTDPDGDALAATFSLRRDGMEPWTDLAVAVKDSFVQFEYSHLPEGVYFTRLVVSEQAPRPEADRLEAVFETDDLVIDRTAPVLSSVSASRSGERLLVRVDGSDGISVLAGVEYVFNNGHKLTVEQPADGILDGREEAFVGDVPAAAVSGATSVEVILYDAVGNSAAQRLAL